MERRISVESLSGTMYRVTIEEDGTKTVHEVTADAETVERYGGGALAPRLLQASFEFLLRREPKESILKQFELSVIERYFPDYPEKIRELL